MSEENLEQETEIQNETQEQEQEQETTEQEEQEQDITSADIDNMSDEEFEEYMNSGKIPEKKPTSDTPQNKPESDSQTPESKTDTNTQPNANTSQSIDYKAVYETLFKPFKANGKEITPRSVEDIVSLMQMGANYTKKMQLLSPMKKTFESLNKAAIKEDDLNFLIDLHNGDKEAIKQLLKKHEIDPLDLDLDDIQYKNNKKNIASDSEVEFSDVLLDIKDSIPKIQEIMDKSWDKKSKELLFNDPNLMRALHEEIQMGRFDKVQKQVEMEKTFGRYKGVSDLEAYIDVVTKMVNAEQTGKKPAGNSNKDTNSNKSKYDKSRAAPTTSKSKPKGSTLTAKDLFSMSEEEFSKLSINDLV